MLLSLSFFPLSCFLPLASNMINKRVIKIGTRKSRLAVIQALLVADALNKGGYNCELIKITTKGDKFLRKPLQKVGGKALFVKEIEQALLKKEIDIAVHSLKDVPSTIPEELALVSFLKRDDPQDAFISPRFDDIKKICKPITIGTTSLRRQTQLKIVNDNFSFKILRGNIDTRLKKLDDKEFDAIVIAYCGIKRLGIKRNDIYSISVDDVIPACGQGVITIQSRKDNPINDVLEKINDSETEICVCLERELQKFIGISCFIPFGAYFEKNKDEIIGRIFLKIENKKTYLKIKKQDTWENRNKLLDNIKKDIKRYLES
ncbi:MAG: hydroxymethylbilane synthase [Candidatus Hydrogenedentota bacterium]